MLAKIRFHRNVNDVLYYNEEKVKQDKADPLWSENFLKDHYQLTTEEKIDRFRQRSSLNDRLYGHGVHFSLNFGRTEKIEADKMVTLSNYYMKGMGFEDQPYLVYRHNDAGHTHLHIVASAVSEEGRKVKIRPGDFARSRDICEEMEEKFSLEKNRRIRPEDDEQYKVRNAQKVIYGEPGLKRAISDVLNTVVDHYNFTSMDEYNAVLKQYNVIANPGAEHSRLRELKGLLYHALDENGNKIGVPLKASSFLLKPTLSYLEERFRINQAQREEHKEKLDLAIEWSFAGTNPDWKEFQESLEKDGISIEISKPKDGSPQRIYFIDHIDQYVFSGEALGRDYSLASLRERCATEQHLHLEQSQKQHLKLHL